MSIHVKHLNADSTFLLTFTLPSPTGDHSKDGTFTVLTDPWLAESGAPQIHPKFAFAARKIPGHVGHLSQIPSPDVVIISQAKPDHCHEDTLRQLPSDLPKTTILAHPDAAKKIRGWKYFNPSKVHTLPSYTQTDHTSVIRFNIPARIPGSTPGEATITLLRQPRDLTRLHNAIAITYRPPMGGVASLPGTPVQTSTQRAQSSAEPTEGRQQMSYQIRAMLSSPALQQHDAQFQPKMCTQTPITPPDTPPESERDPSERSASPVRNFSLPTRSQRQRSRTISSLMTPPESISSSQHGSVSEGTSSLSLSPPTTFQPSGRPRTQSGPPVHLPPMLPPPTAPLPPVPHKARLSADGTGQHRHLHRHHESSLDPVADRNSISILDAPFSGAPKARSISSVSALHAPKPVSVLYAPHGIDFSAVRSYATTHLVSCAALPLTLILHPFARIDNPWWLGGNISAGVPGALEIVRTLMARNWINAHDEEKEESGVGLKMIRKGHWNEKQVKSLLGKGTCNVREMHCGDETRINA